MTNIDLKFDGGEILNDPIRKEAVEKMLVETFGLKSKDQIRYRWSYKQEWIVTLVNVRHLNGFALTSVYSYTAR